LQGRAPWNADRIYKRTIWSRLGQVWRRVERRAESREKETVERSKAFCYRFSHPLLSIEDKDGDLSGASHT
jgi:hypothetical protein